MFSRLIGEGDRDGIQRIAVLTGVIMVAGVVIVALPIALAGDWLFPALFGRDFAASPPVFAILAIGLAGTYSMGLAQALANILDNAAKYTPAGSHIRITAEAKQGEIWVSVSDDGLGLPDGMEHRIFDKFTRGDPESAKSGVGLGLSICRAIVEAHGGRIWASNLPDHGGIFTFALPIGNPPTVPELDS